MFRWLSCLCATAVNLFAASTHHVMFCRFQCQLSAEPEPSVTWLFNDRELTSSPRMQLTFNKTVTTLTIFSTTIEDTGEYTCKATNALGEATTKTFLRVRRMLCKFSLLVMHWNQLFDFYLLHTAEMFIGGECCL